MKNIDAYRDDIHMKVEIANLYDSNINIENIYCYKLNQESVLRKLFAADYLIFDKSMPPTVGDYSIVEFKGSERIVYIAGKDITGNNIYLYGLRDAIMARSNPGNWINFRYRGIGWISVDDKHNCKIELI